MIAEVGMRLPPFEVPAVSTEKMKTMAALLQDPNPIHWDVESVRRQGLGDRVINQGPNNMAYILNMLILWAGDPRRVLGLHIRFQASAYGGERVVAGGEVTAIEGEPGARSAVCDVWLDNGEGRRLIAGTATVALDRP